MRLHSFNEFINESHTPSLKKMALTVANEMIDNRFLYDNNWNASHTWEIITQKNRNLSENLPTLNFSNFHTQRLLSDGMLNEDNVYNKKKDKDKVSSKKEFYAVHELSEFLPKSVLRGGDIKSLKFPIIAKPENMYSGLGIKVFETEEELKKADLSEFEVFSEKIPIDEEYRLFCWRKEPLTLLQRIPNDEKTKTLQKGTDEKLSFKYILHTNPDLKGLEEMIDYFSKAHKGLDFYSLDFVKSGGKIKVIEMSSEPGPSFGVIHKVYEKMYEDHYQRKLQPQDVSLLRAYEKEDINKTLQSDKERYGIKT